MESQQRALNKELSSGRMTQLQYNALMFESSRAYQTAIDKASGLYEARHYLEQQRRDIANGQEMSSLEALGLGMGQNEYAQFRQLMQIKQQFDRQRADLKDRRNEPGSTMTDESYQNQLTAINQASEKTVAATQASYEQMRQAQSSFVVGAAGAWHTYTENARNVAGSVNSVFTNAFGSMESSLSNFVKTGKLSFADLTGSIIDGLAKIATQQTVLGLARMFGGVAASSSISPSGIGGASLVTGTQVTGFYAGGYTGSGGRYEPAGIVHRGEYVFDQPTVNRIGIDNLEQIRKGRGYADGGIVAGIKPLARPTVASRRPDIQAREHRQGDINLTVQVEARQGVSDQEARRQGEQIGHAVMKQIARQTIIEEASRTNGVIFDAVRRR